MAKKDEDLFDTLRRSGLRKKVARALTDSSRNARPGIGDLPSTSWRYSEMKTNIENSEAPSSTATMFAPRSVRRRKIENDITGSRDLISTTTNSTSSAAAPASFTSVWSDPQPTLTASTNA